MFIHLYPQTQCPWDPTTPSLRSDGNCSALVDDDTDESLAHRILANTPWTHAPYCLVPRSIGSEQKFCVYSSSAFNDGSGISIIATPETAATLAAAVQNPSPAWRARRHLAHQARAYSVIPMPGKGMGVIATRRIAQFEAFMTSFPAVIADNDFFPDDEDAGGPSEGKRLFQRALDQLSDKKRFLSLAKSKGEDVHVLEDVLRTNAFGITVNGRDAKGLYPEIARLNHACDPNAYGRFTKGDLAMSAVATRDIMPGEEITISYIPLGMPTPYRAKSLANWGFNCTCGLCSAPAEAREASDQRRERLVDIFYAMDKVPQSDYQELVDLTREFVDLLQIERLEAKVGEYFQAFMRIYYNIGDADSAMRYAKAALRYAETFGDPEGGFCEGLRRDMDVIRRVLDDQKEMQRQRQGEE
ncbi:hypothetical protein B0H63DRAFT_502266 [Podospora didyma]|uniref:SET domain-containing protein n=1 Tax=Podospora didyma TaxID=330526 RepID=A0AAE0KJ76_9PEZI|nr:hypothetical protein B0H63DRAFT_502266 [Podospora didyma]